MIFPLAADHCINPNQAKGIKVALTERSGKPICKGSARRSASPMHAATNGSWNFNPGLTSRLHGEKVSCSGDYWRCRALVPFLTEVLLWNIYWGIVKKNPRDHCDYSFIAEMLVGTSAISLGRCILGGTWAQWQAKYFSSTQYKSHQRIPENIATLALFDWCRCLQVVFHFYRAANLGHLKKKTPSIFD